MIPIGIDDISVAVPRTYISTEELAVCRGVDPAKYVKGIGIEKIAVLYNETLIDLAVTAVLDLFEKNPFLMEDVKRIYTSTESSVDEARSFGEFVLERLEKEDIFLRNIEPPIEQKAACISSTSSIHDVCNWVYANAIRYNIKKDPKGIVIMADEAKYDIKSKGEPTQGCGVVASVISAYPKMISFDFFRSGYYNCPTYDFYRPFGKKTPIVNGHLSTFAYLYTMREAFDNYSRRNDLAGGEEKVGVGGEDSGKHACTLDNFDYFVFHTPYPKMAEYATASLLIHEYRETKEWGHIVDEIGEDEPMPDKAERKSNNGKNGNGFHSLECLFEDEKYQRKHREFEKKFRATRVYKNFFEQKVEPSLVAARNLGNGYTSSLYLALVSLLENEVKGHGLQGRRIGFGAYGSGSSAAIFEGTLSKDAEEVIKEVELSRKLDGREKISIEEYEDR